MSVKEPESTNPKKFVDVSTHVHFQSMRFLAGYQAPHHPQATCNVVELATSRGLDREGRAVSWGESLGCWSCIQYGAQATCSFSERKSALRSLGFRMIGRLPPASIQSIRSGFKMSLRNNHKRVLVTNLSRPRHKFLYNSVRPRPGFEVLPGDLWITFCGEIL